MFNVEVTYEDNEYGDYVGKLRIFHHNKLILEEEDGGEPEDRYFGRDWDWVKPTLEKVYTLGYRDGCGLIEHLPKSTDFLP